MLNAWEPLGNFGEFCETFENLKKLKILVGLKATLGALVCATERKRVNFSRTR